MDRAVGLAAELLGRYASDIDELTLIPSSGGVFEVDADDVRLFSKKQVGRHAQPGEVMDRFSEHLAGAR